MTDKEQIKAAKNFSSKWNGRSRERSNTQHFWVKLVENIFEVEDGFELIDFNQPVEIEDSNNTHEYDAVIKRTKVLIEQKKRGTNLNLKYRQSDGAILTPLEQAKRYVEGYNDTHDYSDWIDWVVTCNFETFRIYDVRPKKISLFPELEQQQEEKPVVTFKLRELHENIKYLKFLVDPNDDTLKNEIQISKSAAVVMRNIREALKKDFPENHTDFLNKLCMRLVFLYYANDSKLIEGNILEKYFEKHKYSRETFLQLFDVLKLKENLRDENISDELKQFPYVNGGLFEDIIEIPPLHENINFEINRSIMQELNFDEFKKFPWQHIDPPAFGAMFESILADDERRAEGMHYTSTENIKKVIAPLFLNELRKKFKYAKQNREGKIQKLLDLQKELANMIFFDPACGSGNFLTVTYLELREIENDIISQLKIAGYSFKDIDSAVKVSINQFFGIEINNYAAAVAQVAMWISENKAFQRTEGILGYKNNGLPLSKYRQIFNENALTTDWNKILPKDKIAGKKVFIFGNPPFVGGMMMSRQQKSDMLDIWGDTKGVGEMDYVSAWYRKALDFIKDTEINCAFVSTNSITQGQQALTMWKPLFAEGLKINFAYHTFKWQSESKKMAAVHCVIIGFNAIKSRKLKTIFDGENIIKAKNINSYLLDAPNLFIDYRSEPLCNVPKMHFGSMPRDGGNLIIEAEDYDHFIKSEPRSKKYIRPYIGADEFIKGRRRYCLWLVDLTLEEILEMPLVAERVEKVKNFRLASKAAATREFAETPHLFCQIAQPQTEYILVPRVSSENRRYIPIGFMPPEVIASDAVQIIPDATIYHFGILISNVHMAWTRAVCGRLEMRYRYSKDIVYNNFVWCSPNFEQRAKIESTAQKILGVLATFPEKTLAYLYDEKTMPAELRTAHLENDAAVMAAYGFSENLTESDIVAELFNRYASLTQAPPVQKKFR